MRIPCIMVLIFLLLSCASVIFASDIGTGTAQSYQDIPRDFVGVVVSVTDDPVDGQWVQLRVMYNIVRIWYKNSVKMPGMGAKIRILAVYIGEFPYPDRYVSIYQGLSWEAIR